MALPHRGSWFGLPDFGITEAIGGLFGRPTTPQGGSNILGTSTQRAQTSTIPTGISDQYAWPDRTSPPPTTTTSGGGDSRAASYYASGGQGDVPVGWNGPATTQPDYAAETRNAINSGYDSYFAELDNIMNSGLPSQQQAQEGIARSQYEQGVNTLGSQRDEGVRQLGGERQKLVGQQNKTLGDLADNIRNLFQAGNVYLGAKGAADSSAANQYSYALTKMGSKQRGDVTSQYAGLQNDVNEREFRLNETYKTESNNLKYQLDEKVNQIASWFAEQQNALRQAKAQGQLSRGQDLAQLSQNMLNVALQNLQQVQSEARNKQSALEEWAMNNSQNIQQLKQNMGSISNVNYQGPQAQPVAGMPGYSGGAGNPSLFGYGSSETPRTNIFGARIV